jgi:hypothetical protein
MEASFAELEEWGRTWALNYETLDMELGDSLIGTEPTTVTERYQSSRHAPPAAKPLTIV